MRTLTITCLSLALGLSAFAASKKVIQPKDFPTGRPYSPGISVADTLYVSGTTGSDIKSGEIPANFEDEVRKTLDNIGMVLKEAGMSFDNAVSVQVYMTDIGVFQRMNTVYMQYFNDPRPARP